jgi:2-epi-5-epi-valiolone 7-kinase
VHTEPDDLEIGVFDLGGTWFRWGIYRPDIGLIEWRRAPAINYLANPTLSAAELQSALIDFVVQHTVEMRTNRGEHLRDFTISVGAPVNAHDLTVLGSAPLWGPDARPLHLDSRLHLALPEINWHIVNDVAALLAPYMGTQTPCQKTLLITISSGIGSRLYNHRDERIPYDSQFGIQGEIGHLVTSFELDGKLIGRRCECGAWNHLNAFSSGRGILRTLEQLPTLSTIYSSLSCDSPDTWRQGGDDYRLRAFRVQLDMANKSALTLLDAIVSPLTRLLATALSLDPDIDRIVITGGVAHGLGTHYQEALHRTFVRDGLYLISQQDPHYLAKRLHWEKPDDFTGLRGAGILGSRARRSLIGEKTTALVDNTARAPIRVENVSL